MSGPSPRKRRRYKKQASTRPPVVPFTPDDDGALCYIRQSHFTDESTSSTVQTLETNRYANAYGIPIIGTVEDLHVSGDLEPDKRDGLKVWLSDAPPKPWKTLVVSKLDRLVRNVLDALELLDWLRARGKRLISIAEGIDSSNSMSEFLITLIVAFARMERERIRERVVSSKARLKEAGRWAGEAHVYGTMPVELPTGGWILGLDPYAVRIIHSISKMAREGKTLTAMCNWLNEKNVASPRNRQMILAAERRGEELAEVELNDYKWKTSSLRNLLRNPDLVELGILEEAEQAEIVVRLDERVHVKTRGSNQPYAFSGVLMCAECLEPLWHKAQPSRWPKKNGTFGETVYHYWYCENKSHGPNMRADIIEPLAEKAFYKVFSMVPVRKRIVLPPTTHANEIAKLEREHAKLMAGVAKAESAEKRQRIIDDGTNILRDIDKLRSLPVDPGGVRWVATDKTWQQELGEMSPEERRLRWIELGYEFAVQKNPDGTWTAGWRLPENWREVVPELSDWYGQIDEPKRTVDITELLNLPKKSRDTEGKTLT